MVQYEYTKNEGVLKMIVELSKREIEIITDLLEEKLESIGILGDAGERFDHGVLKEKLKLLAEECKNERGAGRKKKTDPSEVHRLKQAGATQEEVARKLDISISTVRRNWK